MLKEKIISKIQELGIINNNINKIKLMIHSNESCCKKVYQSELWFDL
jgi:hypothetical protein